MNYNTTLPKQPFDISFDAPQDLTECPGQDCMAYHVAHRHCANDGCILLGEPGGYDASVCVKCGDLLGHQCGREANGTKPLCLDCDYELANDIQLADAAEVDIAHAATDLSMSRTRSRREQNPAVLQRISKELAMVLTLVESYYDEIEDRLDARANEQRVPLFQGAA